MKPVEFKYHVITFLDLPYKDIPKYVCVPWSWIRLQRTTDRKVVVSYPVENQLDTEKRVRRRQRYLEEWNLYMSYVEYSTDKYEDAQMFIQEKLYEKKFRQSPNKEGKLSTPLKEKIHKPKSNHGVDTSGEYVRVSKDDDGSAIKIDLKRQSVPNTGTKITKQSCESCTCSNGNKSSSSTNDTCNNGESTEKTAPERSTQNRTSPSPDTNRSNQEYFTDFSMLLTKLFVSFGDMQGKFDQLRDAFIHNAETMVEVLKKVENFRANNSNTPTASSSNTTQEVTEASETNQDKEEEQIADRSYYEDKKEEQIADRSHYEDEEEEQIADRSNYEDKEEEQITDSSDYEDEADSRRPPKKRKRRDRTNLRKFVLPPEYDANDSKWTLKYHKPAPGLVELMPNTKVYIDAVQFENCKTSSDYYNSLACMLLPEIFTKSALSTCSFTGLKPVNCKTENVRPGLDEHARTVFMTFLKEYGREKDWGLLHKQNLSACIRHNMQSMRVENVRFKRQKEN